MADDNVSKVRTTALISHGGAGKTTLAELLLYNCGHTDRVGKVETGNAALMYDPEETKRGFSINASMGFVQWKGKKTNIIDTPGYSDFVGEVVRTLSVADSATVVFCGVNGIEVGSQTVWELAEERNLPKIAVVNKLDKEHSDYFTVLDAIKDQFGVNVAPITIPIGKETNFSGVINLFTMKAWQNSDGTANGNKECPIPQDIQKDAESYKEKLIEAISETDDTVLEKYLNGEEIPQETLFEILKQAILSKSIVPAFCVSSAKNLGINILLDYMGTCLPGPVERGEVKGTGYRDSAEIIRKPSATEPFSAFVFKTTAEMHVGDITYMKIISGGLNSGVDVFNPNNNLTERLGQLSFVQGKNRIETQTAQVGDIISVVKLKGTVTGNTLCDSKNPIMYDEIKFPEPTTDLALRPKTKSDQEKLGGGLGKLAEDDPTFKMRYDPEFGQTIISGMGELHLEVAIERLKKRHGVEIDIEAPKIPYRETIRGTADVQGKYKRQSGGRGQYGDCWLKLEPLPRGTGVEFAEEIFGGAIPAKFFPAVEKGARGASQKGVYAGYQVIDIKIILHDGTFHAVDSSDMAFQIAGSLAFKKGIMEAKPMLLEPIMEIEVKVPEKYMGDVIGNLNSRRGRIVGMEATGSIQIIKATVPQREMFKYSTDLRSMTHGSGNFAMKFSHYEETPSHITEIILAESKKDKKEEKEEE